MRQGEDKPAESRKVELEIVASQFGSLIAPERVSEMKRDLADLERSLNSSIGRHGV